GDSSTGQLMDQLDITEKDIAVNIQLLSYNVLEFIKDKYKYKWSISEGVYRCSLIRWSGTFWQ
ncbi:MAG: hypothetical protein ACTSSP_08100, partial [Candidatus Asgardarchaeia archaeon]